MKNSHVLVQLSSSLRSLQSITPSHTEDFGKQTLLGHTWWHFPPENKHTSSNYQHSTEHMSVFPERRSTHHRRPPHCCLHSCSGSHTGCFEPYTGRSHTSLHLACRTLHVSHIRANTHTEKHTNLSVTQKVMLRTENCVGRVHTPFVCTIVSSSNRLTASSLVPTIWAVFHPITHSPQRDAASISTAKLAGTGWRGTGRRLE